MSSISFSELRDALDCNQKIEFSLCDRQYFAAPRTELPQAQVYAILDVQANTWVFEGSIDDMMRFVFPNGKTLGGSFDSFLIEYIL